MTNTPADGPGRLEERLVGDNRSDAVSGGESAFEDLRLIEDPAASQPQADDLEERRAPLGAPLIAWLERQPRLEPVAGVVGAVAGRVTAGSLGPVLRGEWLGHPLHPSLTDLPIGCWTSATVIDILAGRRARPAATLLVGAGVLATVPTIAAGLADFTGLDERARRVAAGHAAANAAATALYALSWRSRRRRRHLRGVAWGLAGGVVASLAGFVGGHLAFADSDTG